MKITHASQLSDSALTAEMVRLAGCEREATVALVVHLAEFDRRRLYEGAGYSSLFAYGMAVLRLSEDAVYNRIEAARAARRCPVILDMLQSGALSLTTVRLLARHLDRENQDHLLAAASGRSKQQVEELLAHRFPRPDVPPTVRKLRTVVAAGTIDVPPVGAPAVSVPDVPAVGVPAAEGSCALTSPPSPSRPPAAAPGPERLPLVPPTPRPVVRPIAPERYEIRFTVSAETRDKLRTAQDLLSHAVPSGDIAQVFDRALTLLVDDLTRRRSAATARPRPARRADKRSRYVPAPVKRAVWERDGGRCAFVALDGHRCQARRWLEYDHVTPYAAGGPTTVDNLRLLCRVHNGHEASRFFGPGHRRTRNVIAERRPIAGGMTQGATRSGTTSMIQALAGGGRSAGTVTGG